MSLRLDVALVLAAIEAARRRGDMFKDDQPVEPLLVGDDRVVVVVGDAVPEVDLTRLMDMERRAERALVVVIDNNDTFDLAHLKVGPVFDIEEMAMLQLPPQDIVVHELRHMQDMVLEGLFDQLKELTEEPVGPQNRAQRRRGKKGALDRGFRFDGSRRRNSSH